MQSKGLEEAELLQSQGGSGADRRNQMHSGLMTCLQPGDETDGLDSDTVIDVLDHREQPCLEALGEMANGCQILDLVKGLVHVPERLQRREAHLWGAVGRWASL